MSPLEKTIWWKPSIFKMHPFFHLAIPLQNIYPGEYRQWLQREPNEMSVTAAL